MGALVARARGRGHDFGSHTWEHHVFLQDLPAAEGQPARFKVRTQAGIQPPEVNELTADQYCESLRRVDQRFQEMTGRRLSPIFRAPGGRTSPALLAIAAQRCGYAHVGWNSARASWATSCRATASPMPNCWRRRCRASSRATSWWPHLGIWQRQEPWAPAVLEPLMAGLEARGMLCALAGSPALRCTPACRQRHRPVIADLFDAAQTLLFRGLCPAPGFSLGLGNLLEDAYAATGWLLLGLLQVAAMLLIMLVLERRWPVEPVTDRHA